MKAGLQKKNKKRLNDGVGLVEVLVAAGIIGMIALGIVGAFQVMLSHAVQSTQAIKGAYMLVETQEAVRSIRDRGWSSEIAPLSVDTTYYLSFTGGQWELGTAQTSTDGFTQSAIFGEVERDSDGDIVESGGSVDDATRHITSTVAWTARGSTTTRHAFIYLTDFLR